MSLSVIQYSSIMQSLTHSLQFPMFLKISHSTSWGWDSTPIVTDNTQPTKAGGMTGNWYLIIQHIGILTGTKQFVTLQQNTTRLGRNKKTAFDCTWQFGTYSAKYSINKPWSSNFKSQGPGCESVLKLTNMIHSFYGIWVDKMLQSP